VDPDVPAGTSEPPTERRALRADALGRIAESFLRHGAREVAGGDRHQVVVHVDADTLRARTTGRCASWDASVDFDGAGYMQPPGSWSELRSSHERARIHIDADTAIPRWLGETLDYGLAVELFAQIHRATSGVPAGT
jgi:hypothetical protein